MSVFAPGKTEPTSTLTGLSGPMALAFDSKGNLYVANNADNTVSIFAPNATKPTSTLTGLNAPVALAFDSEGNLYVANGNGTTVSVFAPNATTPTSTLTGLNGPNSLAFDARGNLYVNERCREHGERVRGRNARRPPRRCPALTVPPIWHSTRAATSTCRTRWVIR